MTAGGWLTRVDAVRRSTALGLVLLIGANLIPLIGVLFFGWDVGLVLLTYWVENGIIGILNVPRILLASGEQQASPAGPTVRISGVVTTLGSGGRGFLAAFFLLHYGIFWVVHGVFLTVILNLRGVFAGGFPFGPSGFGFDPFSFAMADSTVLLAGIALFVSHLANLIVNYIGRGEYRTVSAGGQMFAPYPRLIALHVTIIVGSMAILGLGEPFFAVLLLVVIKTIVDIGLYRFDRKRFNRSISVTAQPPAPPKAPAAIV